MKTIFELIRIYTHNKAHYPLRKTQTYDLGLFSTLSKAETLMRKDVKECQEYERERLKDIAENEDYREDEKRDGHNIVLAYRIMEYELDVVKWWSIQSMRTYTADGQPNDECLLDYQCERHFKGRTPDQIRFQPGDIVEVIDEWRAKLCVVGHAQPTTEDYANYRKRCWRRCLDSSCSKAPCRDKSDEYKEENCVFQWDYSDDCYLVYSLGEGDTHFHPESPMVFRPTKPVSKALREKLKAKYEEMKRCYES